MGRHAQFKAAANAGKSSKRYIILALIPLILLGAMIAVILLSGHGPRSAFAKEQAALERQRKDAVAQVVTDLGGTFDASSGVSVITLPSSQAMDVSARQAKELALTTHQRTGGRVRVQTPAGQILAEAP